MLKIPDIYQLELGKLMHSFHNGMLPPTYNRLFIPLNEIHSYSTRGASQGKYFWPVTKNKLGKRSLQCSGPKMWSTLDPELHGISAFAFKKQLKTILLQQYVE